MIEPSEIQWERIVNFGRHTHIIKDDRTLCGRDVGYSRTIIQRNPMKKCKRCLEIRMMINTMLPTMQERITA